MAAYTPESLIKSLEGQQPPDSLNKEVILWQISIQTAYPNGKELWQK